MPKTRYSRQWVYLGVLNIRVLVPAEHITLSLSFIVIRIIPLSPLVFQSHQYKRYGNYKPPVLPICYDDETYFLMLDHVKDEITFDGSAHYPEFMQNIGAISRYQFSWVSISAERVIKQALMYHT